MAFLGTLPALAGALAAGIALWANVRLALFALGTFAYSGINSLGWALHNDPTQAIPMGLTLVGVALGAPYLLSRRRA